MSSSRQKLVIASHTENGASHGRFAILTIASVNGLSAAIIPYVLAAVMKMTTVSADMATYATTAEIAALALCSLVTSFVLHRLKPRSTVAFGALLNLVGQCLSLHASSFTVLIAARTVAGIGGGLCLSMAVAMISQMKDAAKLYSQQFFAMVVITLICFLLIPSISDRWGSASIFGMLATTGIVSFFVAPYGQRICFV
jgi:MFS family permease